MEATEQDLEVPVTTSMMQSDAKLAQHARAPRHPALLVKQRASAGRALGAVSAALGLTGWVFAGHELFSVAMIFIGLMWCRVLWGYVRARKRVTEYEEVWEEHPDWALEKLVSYHKNAPAKRDKAQVSLKASRRRLPYAFGALTCALLGFSWLLSTVAISESVAFILILGVFVAGAGLIVVVFMAFESQWRQRQHHMIAHERKELGKLPAESFSGATAVGGLSTVDGGIESGQLSVSDTEHEALK